jgi:fermentation-respiration switch protein FrsA (DUF1100 family)
MGAVVALTCLAIPELGILAGVADSPFASLVGLVRQLAAETPIPQWVCRKAIKKVRRKVLKKARFDIADVGAIDAVRRCEKPVFFIHGEDDRFVRCSNSTELYDACPSPEKQIQIVPGAHNHDRPLGVVIAATEFLSRAFGIRVVFRRPAEEAAVASESHQHFADLNEARARS